MGYFFHVLNHENEPKKQQPQFMKNYETLSMTAGGSHLLWTIGIILLVMGGSWLLSYIRDRRQYRLLEMAFVTYKHLADIYAQVQALELAGEWCNYHAKAEKAQKILKASLRDGLIWDVDGGVFPIYPLGREKVDDLGVAIAKRVVEQAGYDSLNDHNVITCLQAVVQAFLVEGNRRPPNISVEDLLPVRDDVVAIDPNLTLYQEILESLVQLMRQCPPSLRAIDPGFWAAWEKKHCQTT